MSTEQASSRDDFLLAFFEEEFHKPNPQWQEIETPLALWRVVAFSSDSKKIIAVRSTDTGKVDSYCINLDDPCDFAHIETDARLPFFDGVSEIEAQKEMGLTAPNMDEKAQFDELVDALRLISSVG